MNLNNFEVLSSSEISKIYETSLRILSEIGIVMHSTQVLDLLARFDADVDYVGKRARVSRGLIEETLGKLPAQIAIFNRNQEHVFTIGSGQPRFVTGFDELYISTPSSNWRHITKSDVRDFTRVADSLENIDMIGPQGIPQDVLRECAILHGVEAVISNTDKPLYFAVDSARNLRGALEIVRIVLKEEDISQKPTLIVQLSPISPLVWSDGAADAIIVAAEAGVPICFLSQPISGITAPITLAGAMAIKNAEFLSLAVISQLVNPGSPVIFGGGWTSFNMRKGTVLLNTPEVNLLNIAGAQFARFYGVPSHATGCNSDALASDIQAGWEKGMSVLCALSSGADIIVGAGAHGTALASSNCQLVVDSDIIGMASRIRRGIVVDEDRLAYDAIARTGPGNSFLMDEHTLRHLRNNENWEGHVSNQCAYENWLASGSPSVMDNADRRVRGILASRRAKELESRTHAEVKKVIEGFEAPQRDFLTDVFKSKGEEL